MKDPTFKNVLKEFVWFFQNVKKHYKICAFWRKTEKTLWKKKCFLFLKKKIENKKNLKEKIKKTFFLKKIKKKIEKKLRNDRKKNS